MAYPKLPGEAQGELDDTATQYSHFMHTQQYPIALEMVTNLYNKMLGWQTQYEKRLHKGYPLHSIGYILNCEKRREALKYFILAYVEDLLSADIEDEADLFPPGQTLLLNEYEPEILESLKQIVANLKKNGGIPFAPEEVIRELGKSWQDLKSKVATERKGYRLKKSPIFDANSKREQRVFIGGSGKLHPIINYMKDTVVRLGYHPVVVFDYDVPRVMDTRRKCIILLRTCKYGIFDLSEQSGQLVDINTLHDYDVESLLVWPKGKEKDITEMLDGYKKHTLSYETFPEMENIFREFLK